MSARGGKWKRNKDDAPSPEDDLFHAIHFNVVNSPGGMALREGPGKFGKISRRRGTPDNNLVEALGDFENGEREALLLDSLKGSDAIFVNGNSLSEIFKTSINYMV